jgi:hypothetical protein
MVAAELIAPTHAPLLRDEYRLLTMEPLNLASIFSVA